MNKEFKLTQGEVRPLPSSPGRCSLEKVSVYLGVLDKMASALPLEGLKVICVCSQPCLHSKNLGH